ncbi:SDR family oxidoreductase [Cyclobacteriaceae bacterium]|jgi:NAD(P)-dependent dehydrogenase (short-subunit alcohol dehydrogenase family)|nr:SDR family oxidoreductase [Cyclobacteriaceae bacterium]MDB4314774.1 SDR family oxidoreductase [Cyclobacteriaceae bacterium]MDB4603266.1 SDR family oxidoreductase [Cyclobacteriaceae bacterium]MDB4742185.1 SDR family oxidoreductase [Cyclobacteriaceae bacterium]|tara:strand:- start:1673 stop:2371 length:699 start_codon:yes stop_codon:yes gene_type:complete
MKNILIIGGSSGIGASLIEKFTNDPNYQVIATFNQGNIPTAQNIKTFKFDVLSDTLDLSILPEAIDGVVYCPGSINLLPFHRIKLDAFRADFELQVMGAIKIIQTILPHLKKSISASIVFFSTVAVQSGFNFHTQVAASKGAIEGLTRSLAAELAPKIRVNAIAPSLTDTPLASKLLGSDEKKQANAERHPLKKIGTSENMAEVVEFLLSEKSQWMSGQIMAIDGGISTLRV